MQKPTAFLLLSMVALVLINMVSLSQAEDLEFITPATKNGFGYKWSAINPTSDALPDFVQLSANDSGVTELTTLLNDEGFYAISNGEFHFPFYGETYSLIILSANGLILFGEQYGINATYDNGKETFTTNCTVPQSRDPNGDSSFLRGFAFAWGDYDWSSDARSASSKALFKTFPEGECPFAPKVNESCLVVSFITTPNYIGQSNTKTWVGDATAILFKSGDMLTQVRTFEESTWGVNAGDEVQGLVFGIQSVPINQGFTTLNNGTESACNAYNTYGWDDKADLIQPGDSFQIFYAAPCPGRTGYYNACGSASALSAAWLNLVLGFAGRLLDLFF